MVESSRTNKEKIAKEFVMEAISNNLIIASSSGIKSMIVKITGFYPIFECLICTSLVYKPICCNNCDKAVFCE